MKYLLLLLFTLNIQGLQAQSDVKSEISKLFLGLPVHDGIEAIAKDSSYTFKYSMKEDVENKIEAYHTEIEKFPYGDAAIVKGKLELQKTALEAEHGCYNICLRLYYPDKETMEDEFFNLMEQFDNLGDRIEKETMVNEVYDIISQSCTITLDKEIEMPILSFRFENNEFHQIYIIYRNCIE